jgi:phage gp29-like protein
MDALLSSQLANRKMLTMGAPFSIKTATGEVDEAFTEMLQKSIWVNQIIGFIIDSIFYGTTVVEILAENDTLKPVLIPRQNIIPETGTLLLDETDSQGIDYRKAREYRIWLLEFGEPNNFGILNNAVPHVLFKRFAQSCWSELAEIYGIPPRVLKTNTQDSNMLSRAETMMRDMGAASWYIIDETESFEFAKDAGNLNGDVYNNLINLCNNEISMLVSGAVIGQDTVNGNRSKEESSMKMLYTLMESDMRLVESYMNNMVMKALFQIGILPDGLQFTFDAQEDIVQLWTMTKEVLPFMEVDPEWIKLKFGIEVTGTKTQAAIPGTGALSFFD